MYLLDTNTCAITANENITGKDITLQRAIHIVALNVNGGNILDAGQDAAP
jgi:hypothetical protein